MEYKSTLNLPKTGFPMKANLPQREPETLSKWQEMEIYRLIRQEYKGKKKYVLHDGPPYANGDIHIGHALNKTLKDIIVRYKTMQGYDSPYVPGWDCHGLPVEHQLFKQLGMTKAEIDQVAFRKKAADYARNFVSIQKEQFKRLGVFGDWDNPYLTLDRDYEEAILRSFADLRKKKYIYRGLKPVNWCFKCETALAEAEIEYDNHNSPSIFVKFQILNAGEKIKQITKDKKLYAVVWTTTPWTLIANVAIAVHPDFKYSLLEVADQSWLIQKDLVVSVMEKLGINDYRQTADIMGKDLDGLPYRDIFEPVRRSGFKLVLADYVSKEEGTGLVHTAPGHGQDDYLTGQRYKLETIMPVDSKGLFYQDIAGEFKGEHVFKANPKIIDKLKKQGNLLYASQVTHSYPHCWRCKTAIIFRATEQWFMDIDKNGLREKLLEAAAKDITWIPESGRERISAMISLRPHWCLSRQRYWGVPIPVLSCQKCGNLLLEPEIINKFADIASKEGTDSWFLRPANDFLPDNFKCTHPNCGAADFRKSYKDILDVWFDSGVSHQAVIKKRKELGGSPCALYLEGSDQHRGWFQSSLIPSMAIDSKPPFESVLTHGFVVDAEGKKMSKSLGNVISPQDIIKDYGADILRLWVASSDYNEDIRISKEILSRLSEAYRKIRNTTRFILSNLFDFDPDTNKVDYEKLRRIDKWILFRLEGVRNIVTVSYENFEFHKAYKGIYDFCNIELSMYYLDMAKGRLYTYGADSLDRRAAQTVIYEVLNVLLKLIAPILVFTAEEIWQYFPKREEHKNVASVHLLDWPKQNDTFSQNSLIGKDEHIESQLKHIIELFPLIGKALEEKRAERLIGSSFDAEIILLTKSTFYYKYLEGLKDDLPEIFKVSRVRVEKKEDLVQDISFRVEKAEGKKCIRCWNWSLSVGEDKHRPDICQRCVEQIRRTDSEIKG
ncbi:isoleucine--tRNA ligase [Candidatus Omnitrophota bacterium]